MLSGSVAARRCLSVYAAVPDARLQERSMNRRFWVAIPFVAMMLVPPLAGAEAPIVIKFSHVVALDTPKGKGAEQFK